MRFVLLLTLLIIQQELSLGFFGHLKHKLNKIGHWKKKLLYRPQKSHPAGKMCRARDCCSTTNDCKQHEQCNNGRCRCAYGFDQRRRSCRGPCLPHEQYRNGRCECRYGLDRGECRRLQCPVNQEYRNGQCVCKYGYGGHRGQGCRGPCLPHEVYRNGKCECRYGYEASNRLSVKCRQRQLQCKPNEEYRNGQCQCKYGIDQRTSRCQDLAGLCIQNGYFQQRGGGVTEYRQNQNVQNNRVDYHVDNGQQPSRPTQAESHSGAAGRGIGALFSGRGQFVAPFSRGGQRGAPLRRGGRGGGRRGKY